MSAVSFEQLLASVSVDDEEAAYAQLQYVMRRMREEKKAARERARNALVAACADAAELLAADMHTHAPVETSATTGWKGQTLRMEVKIDGHTYGFSATLTHVKGQRAKKADK